MRALGLLALAACGGPVDSTIDVTHNPCAPLALVSADPTAIQTEGMQRAQDLWRDFGAPAIGLRAGATVDVKFEKAAGAFHGLYDDQAGVIFINADLLDEPTLSIVIAHELGHAFGLFHIEGRPSVMNAGNLTITPNDEDRAALQAIWGQCE